MNQTNDRKKQKRLYLVNRDFQMRYAGAAVVVGLLSTALTTTLILFPLYQFEILRIPRFLPLPVMVIMGMAAVINVALVGLLAIFITHKIAGPMYSLVRHFRSVEEGGVWTGNMRLRDGDDLRYVVRNFNGMMDAITSRLHADLAVLDEISQDIQGNELNAEEKLEKTLQAVNDLGSDIRSRLPKGDANPIAS
ncbi:HAMP domain-containing protein [Pseudobacteriovorax antillogorgiicola]|uniref:HAMP domain-containing protein n=1 Tax=Pseudobacteriovorax antillogorgiicola TaxID=1513793 RepID=A0A1Y6B5F2_9BACT|nr:HAMP domain-containing protein [Pseudobacteriovorax antillogorgiicola]TCS59398.1 HAMP domain-containing protein [Pseudobacteriovorax antillogorgiicola]SME88653.1 HAMP domain-containing protein [Pseudobacteriovorax antillogorgiicola]